MKRVLIFAAGILGGASLLFVGYAWLFAQRADYGWSPAIERPSFAAPGPRVLFDEGHGQRFLAKGTGPLDLSRADRSDHMVNVEVASGAYAATHTRLWKITGNRLFTR